MKTFEEKYTAWIDNRLPDDARIAFERELETVSGAAADRAEAHQLGELLRQHGSAPPLGNADFFSHQIEQRIRLQGTPSSQGSARGWWRWSIPQLLSAGAGCLLLAFVLYHTMLRQSPTTTVATNLATTRMTDPYFAEVVDNWPADPSISASTVYTPDNNLTVVWLDGLEYLPASYELE